MKPTTINTKSRRAVKARIAVKFDSSFLRSILWLIAGSSLVCWAVFVFAEHIIYAHILLGLVGVISFMLIWYYGELADLRPEASLTDADDISLILDLKILAYIKSDNLSPKQLAQLV